jgi:hypothetical protein
MSDLVPISDEQAKALQEIAKTTGTGLDLVGRAGSYVGWVLGTVPADLVGLLGGDWLSQVRIRNLAHYKERTEEILRTRGVAETEAVSPSIAVPLLRAAADESRPELQELWATLLAAALDPKRSHLVRRSFIETLSKFEPLDAAVLWTRHQIPGGLEPTSRDFLATRLGVPNQAIVVSFMNLQKLECINLGGPGEYTNFNISAYGHELIRACSS